MRLVCKQDCGSSCALEALCMDGIYYWCVRAVLIDVYLNRGSRDFSEGSADIH